MLMTTDLLTTEERQYVLAEVPCCEDVRRLAGEISTAIHPDTANAIDAALVVEHGQIRSAMVALEEGASALHDAVFDLCDSVAILALADRTPLLRPFSGDAVSLPPRLHGEVALMRSRSALESASVSAVSASDHLANAHLRLAWEINAVAEAEATQLEDARNVKFDPRSQTPAHWTDARGLSESIKKLSKKPGTTALLPFFICNEQFAEFIRSNAAREMVKFRNDIVHGERIAYQELPGAGRGTAWTSDRGIRRLNLLHVPDPTGPTMDRSRAMLGSAIIAMLPWVQALWDTARRWLATYGLRLWRDADAGAHARFSPRSIAARDKRDPSPYLLGTAPFASHLQ